jgi:predicted DCC family thiol-disulfide oxidoreductase YuxK
MTAPNSPVLLYDGICGLCAASVRFILRHDRKGTLLFAPLQGTLGAEILSRHPELATVDSMIWLDPADSVRGTPEQVSIRSTAALKVVRYLGGWWHLLLAGYLVPRPVRDALYAWVARHRHRLGWGGSDEGDGPRCPIPDEGVRNRFLE